MKPTELRRALAIATDAARAVGALLRKNLRARKVVNEYSAHDIKLELDARCQRLIERKLRAAFPTIPILGEEGIVGDPSVGTRWVVDPIDGTVNFAHDIPHACTIIALQVEKAGAQPGGFATVVGVIYDPFQDELWTAMRGQPARLNGRRIHVSQRTSLGDAMIATGYSKSRLNLRFAIPYISTLAQRARKIRNVGSAGLSLAYVAMGRFDCYLELSINLWDFAAGTLIIEQAGGEFWCEDGLEPNTYRMIADNGRLRKKLPPLPPKPMRLSRKYSIETTDEHR
jgi:myo-inositol-1(or 4)-monophosphatase